MFYPMRATPERVVSVRLSLYDLILSIAILNDGPKHLATCGYDGVRMKSA